MYKPTDSERTKTVGFDLMILKDEQGVITLFQAENGVNVTRQLYLN